MIYSLLFRLVLPVVLVGAAVLALRQSAPGASADIAVDQAGYSPQERKVAYVAGGSGRFTVVDSQERVVYASVLEPARHAPDAGKPFALADFSALIAPGAYAIRLPGGSRSPQFRVGEGAHDEVMHLATRVFLAQRCGAAVQLGLPQDHPACHLEDGVLWEERSRRVPSVGGWHDAGDYGKYTVNGAYSVGLLLTLVGRRQAGTHRPYPPSPRGRGVGGIGDARSRLVGGLLDAARSELEWLLTMQASDGSAHHKLTAKKHPGVVPPEGDRSERYLFPPSSTATGDFAAAMAIAARVYASEDARFAGRCRDAAQRAWRWLEAHPEPLLFRNPPGVNTGTYGDKDDRDERLWAAVELHRATGDAGALARVREIAGRRRPAFTYAGSWADVANVALLSLLDDKRLPRDDALRNRVEGDLLSFARRLATRCAEHPLGVVLSPRDYYWGSNGVALNYALILLEAGRYARDDGLVQAGRDQVHYLLGQNALGLSFVTGVGERGSRHPHHAPSILTRGQPALPGLLVGGPNHKQGKHLSEFPATAYADDAENWTVNEPAINLNAELVLVLGLMGAGR